MHKDTGLFEVTKTRRYGIKVLFSRRYKDFVKHLIAEASVSFIQAYEYVCIWLAVGLWLMVNNFVFHCLYEGYL